MVSASLPGIVDADRGDHRVVMQVVRQLDVLLEQRHDAAHRLLDVAGGVLLALQHLDDDAVEALVFLPLDDAGALDAFDQHLDVAVRQLEALHHVGDAAHREDVLGLRIVGGRVVLRRQEDPLVLTERMFERADRRRPSDDERHHHVWKNNDVPQRDDREGLVDFDHIL